MIEIYACINDVHEKLNGILAKKLDGPFKILKTGNGKPFIEGNPVHFSLSHSGEKGIIAVSDKPVGIDLEIFRDRIRNNIIKRFSEREQAEILDERDFLAHWTAREAYVKLYGHTLAKTWRRIEFFGGKIYFDGQPQNIKLCHYYFPFGVTAICSEE